MASRRPRRQLPGALLTPTVGVTRTRLVASLLGKLGQIDDATGLPVHRLITLGGAPGIGKTHTALALLTPAAEQGRHTGFAYLGEITPDTAARSETPNLDTIARAVQEAFGITDISTADAVEVLIHHLKPRGDLDPANPRQPPAPTGPLLIIDNCEQLLEPVGDLVAILLAELPDVQVVATSRGELGIPGEQFTVLEPLSIPAEGADRTDTSEALALLLHHVRAGGLDIPDDQWEATLELARWSGGLPLVLGMVAGRIKGGMSPTGVLDRLDGGRLLTSKNTRRLQRHHQTLQQALTMSYDLCSLGERRLLERFAVFAGGAGLDMVENVCGGGDIDTCDIVNLLAGLVNVALLAADGTGRYQIYNPIREFALVKLRERGEERRIRNAHVEQYRAWIKTAAETWLVPTADSPTEVAWLERTGKEIDNLRAAMSWARTQGTPEVGLEIALDLARLRYWWHSGLLPEGSSWIDRAMRACSPDPTPLSVAAGSMLGWMLLCQGDPATAATVRHDVHRMVTELGLTEHPPPPVDFLDAAYLLLADGDPACLELFRRARAGFDAGARAGEPLRGDRHQVDLISGLATGLLGTDSTEVRQIAARVLDEARQGRAEWALSWGQWVQGLVPLIDDDPRAALAQFQACLRSQVALGDRWGSAWTILAVFWALARGTDPDHAARVHGGSVRLQEDAGSRVVGLHPFRGQTEAAVRLVTDRVGAARFDQHSRAGRALTNHQVYELAMRPWPDGTRAPDPGRALFTPTEDRIVALLIEGATNREIAERLTVSSRTVEGHVTRILAKLGVERRAAIRHRLDQLAHSDDHTTGNASGPRSGP
ncbi:ATP-binding protein [Actinokineospora terrae]|nr:LuxR C-terminal-related transcriptional regulator [Actinokineospora terrae]